MEFEPFSLNRRSELPRCRCQPRPPVLTVDFQTFCTPADMKFDYPNNTGISYSLYVSFCPTLRGD